MSIYNRTETELLTGKSTAPGRVRTFLLNPRQRTTPHSCTRYEWGGDLGDLLAFACRALKGGSGVKITFPTTATLKTPVSLGEWELSTEAIEGDGLSLIVTDSIEGQEGLLDSWNHLINELDSWHGINICLGKLRPQGMINSNGLVASGAESFASIYRAIAKYLETGTIDSLLKLLGTLNHVMRRGGYKKGIITSAMSSECELITDYLNVPVTEIDGSHKKGVVLHNSAFDNPELIDLIISSRNSESTFIEKPCGDGLAMNVCEGLVLGHKATCLIWRVNLGMCKVGEIVEAFKKVALDICELHTTWRSRLPELATYYAPLENDRQVGLDVMGLANLLAIEGVTYKQFADALQCTLKPSCFSEVADNSISPTALEIAREIVKGYEAAKLECDRYMEQKGLPLLDRIFTVEPAQSHSYETFDRVGKTTCRGIFAPTGRIVKPVSTGRESKRYFHGNVETDAMVGVELHERLCDLWQGMMDSTGVAHAISQDSWREMSPDLLLGFTSRPSKTLYYSEAANYNQRGFLAKTVQDVEVCSVDRPGECEACAG